MSAPRIGVGKKELHENVVVGNKRRYGSSAHEIRKRIVLKLVNESSTGIIIGTIMNMVKITRTAPERPLSIFRRIFQLTHSTRPVFFRDQGYRTL